MSVMRSTSWCLVVSRIHTEERLGKMRWNIERLQLCYRCLAEGHSGKSCPRSRQCAEQGCVELHHKLLHRHENTQSQKVASNLSIMNLNGNSELNTSYDEQAISGMEGKEQTHQTTMTA